MNISNPEQAFNALLLAWPKFVSECRLVLGSEHHYQAVLYHCLRLTGVPACQLGMNVKQYIPDPKTQLGRSESERRQEGYKGFEPTPDATIFHPGIMGDWRRRRRKETLMDSLLSIEMKVSEREGARLRPKEVINDIKKLSALRQEIRHRYSEVPAANTIGLMIVVDTAPDQKERMTPESLQRCREVSREWDIRFGYLDGCRDINPANPLS
ncbi:MAG: hypothetical protein F4160_06730 [Rhodospirillaceae bacterium]|nr:hypothetical protein [Rhodospirillaceae bacterium]MYH36479.1 hypothetical protein [Rhodospirillaceae bacterium]MYK13318.1 hypothetical protein [Rhodospirillaceae bacterium]